MSDPIPGAVAKITAALKTTSPSPLPDLLRRAMRLALEGDFRANDRQRLEASVIAVMMTVPEGCADWECLGLSLRGHFAVQRKDDREIRMVIRKLARLGRPPLPIEDLWVSVKAN